jgi:hypothetical protein
MPKFSFLYKGDEFDGSQAKERHRYELKKQMGSVDLILPNFISYNIPVIVNQILDSCCEKDVKEVEFIVNAPLPSIKIFDIVDQEGIPVSGATCIQGDNDVLKMVVNSSVMIEIALEEILSINWTTRFLEDFKMGQITVDDDTTDGLWTFEFMRRKKFLCLERIYITYRD